MSDSAGGFLPPTPPTPPSFDTAPPSIEGAPPMFGAAPPMFGAPESVVIDVAPPAPRKSKAWMGIAAAVVVVGAGVGVFAATRGSDNEGERFSLTAAATGAQASNKVAFEMKLDMGDMGDGTITARFDGDAERMAMDMDVAAGGQDVTITAIIDLAGQTMYMDASTLVEQGAEIDTKWVSIDLADNPAFADSFESATGNNPLDIADLFTNADQVEDLGPDTVNGEDVKHYRVTVDIADVLAAQPQVQEQFDNAGTELPDEVVYDVYVTADNQLRRLTYDLEIDGQTVATDMIVTAVGDIEPIELPDPADVTDFADVLGG